MKVLFIGGTGIISSASVKLAVARGIDLYVLNRGQSALRPLPPEVKVLHGDIRDPASAKAALGDLSFDSVVDWVAFTTAHVQTDIDLFRGRTGQYVFISSASAYQTPPLNLPVTESSPLRNPHWAYSRDKIACEDLLVAAYRSEGFPATIVRPSHTYDASLLPFDGGYNVLDRMLKGQPVIVHGDGTSLWTLTHHSDFAKGLVGLLGNPRAIGDAFQITSDESLSWNQIFDMVAAAAGVEARKLHVPSDLIASYNPDWGAGLLGDKAHSMVFDNTKIKRLVPDFHCVTPFARGAGEIVAWYRQHPAQCVIDEAFEQRYQQIISAMMAAFPR